MKEKHYLLVDSAVVPQVFLRVLRAKELLAGGEAKNVSQAVQMADISRSAFYKYKDAVFQASYGSEVITLRARLRDETGALQTLLTAISEVGAGVVTIHQSSPENGAADVAVSVRTQGMKCTMVQLLKRLEMQDAVVGIWEKK